MNISKKTKKTFDTIFIGIMLGHMAGIPVFLGWLAWMHSDLEYASRWLTSESHQIIFYGTTWGAMIIGIIVVTILIHKNKIFKDDNNEK